MIAEPCPSFASRPLGRYGKRYSYSVGNSIRYATFVELPFDQGKCICVVRDDTRRDRFQIVVRSSRAQSISKSVSFTANIDGMRGDNGKTKIDNEEWTAADVRAWAADQGIEVAQRGRIPNYLVELYLARPAVVRQWARRNGFQIGERGPLPGELLTLYLARPSAVRAWAREQGIDIGERGRIPQELVESYLERFGELTTPAA